MSLPNSKQPEISEGCQSPSASRVASPLLQNQPHRPHPQPRYLSEPTALESISSAFTGISSYVRKSIPDALLTKAFQPKPLPHPTPLSPSSFPPSFGGDPRRVRGIEGQQRSRVTFAAFDHLTEGRSGTRRLCLLLGYADGFHVWEVDDVGKISELALAKLDLGELINPELRKPGAPKILIGSTRVLPIAPNAEFQEPRRPEEFAVLTLYCLATRSRAAQRVFEREAIAAIESNDRCVVVATTLPSIRVLSCADLTEGWVFSDVLPNPNTRQPVFALGPRWLAYSTTSETPWKANLPEHPGLRNNVKVDRVAKDVVNGLKLIGDYGYQQLNSYLKPSPELDASLPRRGPADSNLDGLTSSSFEERGFPKNSGRVVVRDLNLFGAGPDAPPGSEEGPGMSSVAHFQCHYYPISNLAFNGTGNLLATSSVEGHTFYIFEITQCQPPLPPFRTLYKLSRGFTDARVVHMTFNGDSRWLATTTHHGTTHLFLINPYGGLPHAASHLEARVLNGAYAAYPTSLAPGVRFRRKQVDALEEANTESVRGESICAVHFLPSSHSLSRWLSKLPPSYDLPPAATRASNVVLTVDSEGVLKLLRVSVSKKAPPPNFSDKPTPQDFAVSTNVDSIAEWALAKLPTDTEKWFASVQGQPSSEECKPLRRSPQWEPEMAWLPFVETRSYDPFVCPSRPLWALRQFEFKVYCEDGAELLDPECFTKDQRRTRALAMRHQNVPHVQGAPTSNDDLHPCPSHEEIEGHLVHAMETKLDKPAMPKRLPRRKEALSFEDALEIHMVHPVRKAPEKPMTEIPTSYAEEEAAYYYPSADDVSGDQFGVFTMDELDGEALGCDDPHGIGPDPEVGCPGPASDASQFGADSSLALTSSMEDI
ncbi:hypothetical protein L0F63_000117 [Massospora cicadina]|nr:hypothetical protein L0F63_000117 [Massospora cicadina]